MKGITKEYPGVRALKSVDFDLREGEVHALVGENGAGKSTLMKILGGADTMTGGEIWLHGRTVNITGPREAERLGVGVIYQEFNLIPYLTVAENIFLGREPRQGAFVDWQRLYADAQAIVDQLGLDVDLKARVKQLSIAQQQMVEIAKAISKKTKIIVMDEPSATLTPRELERLFTLTRTLKAQGVGFVFISHRLEEVFEIADRVTVLRDGELISTNEVANVTRASLIRDMVGRELRADYPERRHDLGEVVLEARDLSRPGLLNGVSLALHKGEILGITGLVGAGRTELARALFGADPLEAGEIMLEGKPVRLRSPAQAIAHGICLMTEDRKNQGLVLGLTVRENISLACLKGLTRGGFIQRPNESSATGRLVEQLNIKTPSLEQRVRNLSGGNQQKVALAKWLSTQFKVILFDEPTRGIDVGAKQEIHRLMNDLAETGVGIIMVSSELPEVLGMSDRILVMRGGRIQAEFGRSEATQENIMHFAALDRDPATA
jgi:ribose transport system ATP-binding protein